MRLEEFISDIFGTANIVMKLSTELWSFLWMQLHYMILR